MSKRAYNGAGTFTKKSNGRIEYRFCLGYDENGKLIRRSVSGRTQTECKKKRRKLENELKEKNLKGKTLLKDWIPEFRSTYRNEESVSTTTGERGDSTAFRRIEDKFGNKRLCDIQKVDVKKWVNEMLKEGLKPKTISNYLSVFRVCMDEAVENRWIPSNPVKSTKKLLTKKQRESIHNVKKPAMTVEQEQAFLKAAENDEFYNEICFALLSGCRDGEILGLTWEKVTSDSIIIDQQLKYTKKKGYHFGEPKWNDKRVLARNDCIDEILLLEKEKRERIEKIFGFKLDSSFVFINSDGTHRKFSTFRNHVKKIGRSIGCDWISIHTFRRTCATRLHEQGVDDNLTAKLLGHNDVNVTRDKYIDSDLLDQKRVAEATEKMFKKISN